MATKTLAKKAADEVRGHRLATRGSAMWDGPEGHFTYIELVVDDLAYTG